MAVLPWINTGAACSRRWTAIGSWSSRSASTASRSHASSVVTRVLASEWLSTLRAVSLSPPARTDGSGSGSRPATRHLEFEGPPNIDHLEISSQASRLEAYSVEDGTVTAWVWSLEDGAARLLRSFECGPEHNLYSLFLGVGWNPSRQLFAKSGPGKAPGCGRCRRRPVPTRSCSARGLRNRLRPLVPPERQLDRHRPDTGPDPVAIEQVLPVGHPVAHKSRGVRGFRARRRLARLRVGRRHRSPVAAHRGSACERAPLSTTPRRGSTGWPRTRRTTLLVGAHYVGAGWFRSTAPAFPARVFDSLCIASASALTDGSRSRPVMEDDSATRIHVFSTDTLEEIAVLEPEATKASIWVDEKRSFLPDGRIMSALWSSGLWISDPRPAPVICSKGPCDRGSRSARTVGGSSSSN